MLYTPCVRSTLFYATDSSSNQASLYLHESLRHIIPASLFVDILEIRLEMEFTRFLGTSLGSAKYACLD